MNITNTLAKPAFTVVLALSIGIACRSDLGAQTVSRIVFQANVASGKRASYSQIFSMNPDGSGVTQLTSSSTNSYSPRWSPGQQYISFYRAGQLWVMQAQGETYGAHSFTVAPASPYGSDWSPDGGALVFRGTNAALYLVGVNATAGTAGAPVLLTSGYWYNPSWSPDGTKIAANGSYNGSVDVISVFDANTGAEWASFGAAADQNFAPQWSPDGTRVAFTGSWTFTSVSRTGKTSSTTYQEVFLANPDGTGITQLTDWLMDTTSPTWSPDGTALAFRSNNSIYRTILGSNVATLLFSGGINPDWNP